MTEALSLRELEERFKYGRTQWGQFRKGSKVLPSWLVDDLVPALVKPQAQQVQLQLGRRLQKAAEAAAVAREAQSGSVPMGTEVELQVRLDEARKATIEAQKTLLGTTQVIYMLLQLVTSLQGRCEALEAERDRATAPAASLDRVQQELAATKQKVDLAKKKLKRARETREEAEELNVTAEVTAARHERALECVRAAPLEAPDGPGDPAEEAPADAAEASSVVDGLRPLWEYDADLEAADQQMEAHQADLDVLRSQMGIDAAEEGGNILQGVVVHEDAADNRATSEDGSVSHNVPSPAVEETALHMGKWPADPFIRPPGAPRDVSEVDDPEAGRLCLGALYVPEVSGVRLHFGLLNGKPVGLIAEIDDYQFEIRLRLGLRNMGTWSRHNFATARDDLAESGPVTNWIDRDQLLPGWGPAVATEYSVASTVRGSKQQYQVIVTGCDGPGWVLQLTCFRPLKFIGSALERSTFRLLRAVLEDSVIAPSGRMEAGHYVLERPTSHPAPRRSSFTYKIKSAEPSVPATGGRRKSTLSTDNADNSTTRENPVRAASTDNVASKRRPRVSAPRWVVVKDTVACLTMLLWTGSLAAGLTYRQEANLKFFWDGVLTYLMVSFMLVASAVIFGLVIAMSNFTHTREGAIREPAGTSCLVIGLTGVLTLVSLPIASANPDVLPWMGEWGKILSDTLLA
ncbi:DUF3710 domain-containing protein [Streptomyces sp. NBC_01352]|uniref:DUF3710 domain-containing protein n=1 Tax=Streptomyces sp. NBC_01352 TaxID=2903834 RepID=UPI002E33E06C|nr:DUF3710 domain-containing protein [Streptomyces sp. NBC_01352]